MGNQCIHRKMIILTNDNNKTTKNSTNFGRIQSQKGNINSQVQNCENLQNKNQQITITTSESTKNQVQIDLMNIVFSYTKDSFISNIVQQNKSKIRDSLRQTTREQKIDWVRQNVIGLNSIYSSSLGLQLQAIYVDHTATNRPFKTVEKMVEYVKLYVANPHTEYSQFGKFSTDMLHYSQLSLLNSFSADQKDYVVIPTGSGSTGAIKHYIQILRMQQIYRKKDKKLTVFITPYQHHSNILPWVEFIGKVEILAHNKEYSLIMSDIQNQLRNYPSQNIIVSVSAASNVTSKMTNLKNLNQVIRKVKVSTNKNIIFGVDCAAFCCHHELNLKQLDQIDMCYISPHKNLGGVESCGLLLIKKNHINNKPSFPGGGTVKFVSGYKKQNVQYDDDAFSREVAGTPSFLGFYRAALSFQLLKDSIGYDFIHQNERKNTQTFLALIKQTNQNLNSENIKSHILTYGEQSLDQRANIVTFNIVDDQKNKVLPHSFVSLFLTDIFGIQIRSGCFCAGPYGIQLLQIDKNKVKQIQKQVEAGMMVNKPGYLRLDLTFYLMKFQVKYIAKALKNLMELYEITSQGHVRLIDKFSNYKKYQYDLKFAKGAQSIVTKADQHKLDNRPEILKQQLEKGKQICENPQIILKRMK